jgi:uncharacterized protein (DUF1015 family)
VPRIRSFRALRYAAPAGEDLERIVAPPYDVVDDAEYRELLARHPKNAVRLDLPREEAGDEPDARYRRASRTLAEWRSDGTLKKDVRPSVYVYEQTYTIPGTDVERTQRGFFGRLALEPLGEGTVLPHERTLAGPREDRYKLLRATGVNTSPVVVMFPDTGAVAVGTLAALTAAAPDIDVADAEGVRHRLWVVPDDGSPEGPVAVLVAAAEATPITIADGHHRYETALQYRDERRMSRSCEEDPAFDYLLALLLPADQALTVLATHRLVRGLGDDGVVRLRAGLDELFEVTPATADELLAAFGPAAVADSDAAHEGRIGFWSREGGAILRAREAAFEPLMPSGGPALRRLDVTRLGVALDRLAGVDAAAVAEGRLAYTKSAAEALAAVDAVTGGADAAFLLLPTPPVDIMAVAADRDVLPQKSSYFYPKALTGLVINPHEW